MRFGLDGTQIVVRAEPHEQQVLGGLLQELVTLATGRRDDPNRGDALPTDPALARLLPDPVHGDPAAAAELRRLTETSLITHKLRNAEAVQASLAGAPDASAVLDDAQELAWLKTLTDLRLVLAARLGIEHDGDPGRSATEVDRWMQTAYHWLGWAQAGLLDAIELRDGLRDRATGPGTADDGRGDGYGDAPHRSSGEPTP